MTPPAIPEFLVAGVLQQLVALLWLTANEAQTITVDRLLIAHWCAQLTGALALLRQ